MRGSSWRGGPRYNLARTLKSVDLWFESGDPLAVQPKDGEKPEDSPVKDAFFAFDSWLVMP